MAVLVQALPKSFWGRGVRHRTLTMMGHGGTREECNTSHLRRTNIEPAHKTRRRRCRMMSGP
jgi:hypothetical protein